MAKINVPALICNISLSIRYVFFFISISCTPYSHISCMAIQRFLLMFFIISHAVNAASLARVPKTWYNKASLQEERVLCENITIYAAISVPAVALSYGDFPVQLANTCCTTIRSIPFGFPAYACLQPDCCSCF